MIYNKYIQKQRGDSVKRVIFNVTDEQLHELKAYCVKSRKFMGEYMKDLIHADWKINNVSNEKIWEEELK
jgi:hypothetical protein